MTRFLIAVLVMVTTGCASTSEPVTGPPTDSIRIGLVEWDITTSSTAAADGVVTFEVTNAGTTTHDLRISDGITEQATPVLAPGETAILSLRTDAGTDLELWCSLPGHRQQGMERRLQPQ
jgi:hypothetical protein